MKKRITNFLMICASAVLVLITSCKKEEEVSPTGNIEGVVVEKYTGNPIPFARLIVYTSIPIDFFNSTDSIIDTLKADAQGKFELSRVKYKDIYDKTGHSSFYVCGNGPSTEGTEYYYDNCSSWGTNFSWDIKQTIKCELNTIGWLRILSIDDLPSNPEVTHINVQHPWNGSNDIGIPIDNSGASDQFLSIVGNLEYEIFYELLTLQDNIPGNNSTGSINAISLGKDTVDLFIHY